MASPVTARVQKRRDVMRAAGLRPIQIWVPDTRRPSFAEECRRQSGLAARLTEATRGFWIFSIDAWTMSMAGRHEAWTIW